MVSEKLLNLSCFRNYRLTPSGGSYNFTKIVESKTNNGTGISFKSSDVTSSVHKCQTSLSAKCRSTDSVIIKPKVNYNLTSNRKAELTWLANTLRPIFHVSNTFSRLLPASMPFGRYIAPIGRALCHEQPKQKSCTSVTVNFP